MATTINVITRVASASQMANLQSLLAKLGITGTAASPLFATTVATPDDDRADAILNSLANDPAVGAAQYG